MRRASSNEVAARCGKQSNVSTAARAQSNALDATDAQLDHEMERFGQHALLVAECDKPSRFDSARERPSRRERDS